MKHGKKPTVQQRKYIESKGINAENWLVSKDTQTEMVLVHRLFDETKLIKKESNYES